MSQTPRYPLHPILIVDDEPAVLLTISATLGSAGMNNRVTCQDGRQVMDILRREEAEVILLDLVMPHVSGQELLLLIREAHPDIPIIIVTGTEDVQTAVRCMHMGVFDYLVKAVEKSKLVATVRRAVELRELRRENTSLGAHLMSQELQRPECFSAIATCSPEMQAVFLYVESIAPSSQCVLVTGETGTGKELIAHAIHGASGRTGELVPVNIAGLDESMFADTLFGHLRGAFTGADQPRKGLIVRAAKGTLFLDEIGDLTPPAQVRLLRLLESHEYYPLGSDTARASDARVVVATNKDLALEAHEGRFRRDLFFRLRTHHVHIPPLRDRPEDIPLLLNAFATQAARELGKGVPPLSPSAVDALSAYPFPGNVRELRSLIFDAIGRHRGGPLTDASFPEVAGVGDAKIEALDLEEPLFFRDGFPTLRRMTEFLIETALKRAAGNQARAARLLGISPQALSRRLKTARG